MRSRTTPSPHLCSTTMSLPAERPSPTLRPIQMLSAIVGMGAVMISAVRIVVDPAAPMPSWGAVAVVVLALVAATVLITYVGYSVPSLPLGLPRENAAATSLKYFTSTTTMRVAIAEAPVLIAFVVTFVFEPHSWLPLLIALPGALALFWVHGWPSARTAAATERGLEADGAESYLSESLGFR